MDENSKRPGRPRKYEASKDRIKAYRRRKSLETCRVDAYLSITAYNRISDLSKAWGCSKGAVVERLVMEASEAYRDILFPETE